MKQKIKELAEQAFEYTQTVAESTRPGPTKPQRMTSAEWKVIYNQKFAEFIVRECANAAYQSLYEDRIFDDSPHIIRTKVMDDIKKHFGFEE